MWVAHHPEIAAELQVYFEDLAATRLAPSHRAHRPLRNNIAGRRVPSQATQPPAADFQPGDVLGDYVLLEKLGEGGQGVVWKARPPGVARDRRAL